MCIRDRYNIVPGNDLGLAIIVLTVIIKLILYPFSRQSIKSQKALQDLQPKIAEIKKQYKDNKEEQAKQMMQLYKDNKVNPFSSCLPLLIQLPFLIAVFQVFRTGLDDSSLKLLYPFVSNPGQLNPISFGFLNLAEPNVVLALLTGAVQFWQTKMLSQKRPSKVTAGSKDEDAMAVMNKQMMFIMPLVTVFIGVSLPAGLVLYWFVVTILTVLQQQLLFSKKEKQQVEVIGSPNQENEDFK